MGGNIALMHEGKVIQRGPTADVFRQPDNLEAARVFSDPPINTLPAQKTGNTLTLADKAFSCAPAYAGLADGSYEVGIRPYHIQLEAGANRHAAISGTVTVNEISGSESFIHVDILGQSWVALLPGIKAVEPNQSLDLYLDPGQFYLFRDNGQLAWAPGA